MGKGRGQAADGSRPLRLDRFIAAVTDLSRADAKRAIKAGAVTVAGAPVCDPGFAVAATAPVALEGRPLRSATHRYFMLHKPEGCVCAARDRHHTTVLDLLDEDNREALHVAGRLDIDTTGLVLLTDDGRWSHRLTSPHSGCAKTYLVHTAEPIPAAAVRQFAQGLFLHAEKQRLQPAGLELLDERCARLTIREGRYHQVKRMFGALGNAVVRLHRERIGDIALDAGLAPGQYRLLSAAEVASV